MYSNEMIGNDRSSSNFCCYWNDFIVGNSFQMLMISLANVAFLSLGRSAAPPRRTCRRNATAWLFRSQHTLTHRERRHPASGGNPSLQSATAWHARANSDLVGSEMSGLLAPNSFIWSPIRLFSIPTRLRSPRRTLIYETRLTSLDQSSITIRSGRFSRKFLLHFPHHMKWKFLFHHHAWTNMNARARDLRSMGIARDAQSDSAAHSAKLWSARDFQLWMNSLNA